MSQPLIRRSFREEQGRRIYELENEKGDRVSVEETSDPLSLRVHRDEKEEQAGDAFAEALVPLLTHFVRYGNLPLPPSE